MNAPIRIHRSVSFVSRSPEPIIDMIRMLGTRKNGPQQHDKHVSAWRWNAYEMARERFEAKFGRISA